MSGAFQVPRTEAWTGAPYGSGFVRVAIPDPLVEWLTDLTVLRGVPLHYLVPDAALVPPESIRFVQVDPVLVGQLVDGALAAATLGGGDVALGAKFRADVLRRLACELAWRAQADVTRQDPGAGRRGVGSPAEVFAKQWDAAHPAASGTPPGAVVAGVLIRSELVQRYPSMIVRASCARQPVGDPPVGDPLGCVRRERLAPSIMLALFHGARVPDRIELLEPDEGVRFGVEPGHAAEGFVGPVPRYQIDYRDGQGVQGGSVVVGQRKVPGAEVLEIGALAAVIAGTQRTPADSTSVARCLQQTPFIQIIGNGPRPAAWEPKR